MPEYEYKCKKCDQIFSIERSMNESSDVHCIHCHGNEISRVWGANFVGISSKGSTTAGAPNGAMCNSNPTVSKSCCPCGPSASGN